MKKTAQQEGRQGVGVGVGEDGQARYSILKYAAKFETMPLTRWLHRGKNRMGLLHTNYTRRVRTRFELSCCRSIETPIIEAVVDAARVLLRADRLCPASTARAAIGAAWLSRNEFIDHRRPMLFARPLPQTTPGRLARMKSGAAARNGLARIFRAVEDATSRRYSGSAD